MKLGSSASMPIMTTLICGTRRCASRTNSRFGPAVVKESVTRTSGAAATICSMLSGESTGSYYCQIVLLVQDTSQSFAKQAVLRQQKDRRPFTDSYSHCAHKATRY